MAVDVTQGIPFSMDTFTDTEFVVPNDTSGPDPIPKMICRMGPWDGTAVTLVPKKLLTTVDNAAQFQFELYGWNLDNYDTELLTFDVFLETQGPRQEWGPTAPPGTLSLTADATNFSITGTDISGGGGCWHMEYALEILFPMNQISEGTHKVVTTVLHNDPDVPAKPPAISGFCEVGFIRFVDAGP